MKKTRLLMLLFASATIFFGGCTKDSPEQNNETNHTDIGGEYRIQCGTDAWWNLCEIYLRISPDSYFILDNTCEISCIGKIDWLSDITTIPGSGWGYTAPVMPGQGYVLRKPTSAGFRYVRIYVVESIKDSEGGILGYVIRGDKLDF